jgi:predicted amidohydrolase
MRLAVAQMTLTAGDLAANLRRLEGAVSDAAAKGADLLLAPELALPGYGAGDAMARLAEVEGGAQIAALRAMALRYGVAIVAGLAESCGADVYNAAVFTDGDRVTIYRKSHLYGDYERGMFRPGPPKSVTFDHAGLKCGLLICYDVEFPENVRRLALDGVQVVLAPTATPAGGPSGFIADHVIPVRAFENQIFVAYANHCGTDGRFDFAGRSHIVAPDGTTLAQAQEDEALLIVDLNPAAYDASRRDNPYLRDLLG